MSKLRRLAAVAIIAFGAGAVLGQAIGQPAPDLNVPDYFGTDEHISLNKYRGQILAILFWRSDDKASTAALKKLNDIQASFVNKGVAVLALSNEGKERAEKAAKEAEVEYLIGYGPGAFDLFELSSWPRVYLLDPQGIIVWKGPPDDGLKDVIADQIERTPPAGLDAAVLQGRYDEAVRLKDAKEIGRAYSIVSSVVEAAAEGGGLAKKAQSLKEELEKASSEALERVREAVRDKKYEEAANLAAALQVHFEGGEIGRDLSEQIDKIRSDDDGKSKLSEALRQARATRELDQAAGLEAAKEYSRALDAYRTITETQAGTTAAAEADKAIERIKSDASIKKHLADGQAEDEAYRWLDIADRYLRLDMKDKAREFYERVVKVHPDSRAAKRARERLRDLKG
jgi:tetratricopeptide (TPR) repeat protein